ncbi:LuxR C-terminal-related transcriptional regulator [Streptomyces sp. NBC_01643]|uniref:ATP-binding protein n=1 Tax=Streptomyces sp. NBC_01643 TaxID=2975906 RepID=UPI002F914F48|nr:LuxR C-terminal-related transcriptional regulator [Streptomyces sp. NBC_01643]
MAAKAAHQAGNLPAELTSLVGRQSDVARTRQALSETRLLTLTGPGGVGKTRLALRVAAEVQCAFPSGSWMVELAPLKDATLLSRIIAEALGVQDQSARPPLIALTDNLVGRQLLLVLDNCEHLLDACATVVKHLLAKVPDLRVLATSREPLGVEGERVVSVSPLSSPDPSPLVDDLSRFGAVTLFLDRAAAAAPGFEITNSNRSAVVRLCRRLDGIPLAIELAAVRLRALTVEELLEGLDNDRFALLTTGDRGALARQQTLQAAIDWSYDLCSPQEQMLWARLSVFSGGCDLQAAEQVCAGDGINSTEIRDLVAGLVDKSILVRYESSNSPRARYRLLETVHQYGAKRLSHSRQEPALRERHVAYYKQLAATSEKEFFSPRQAEWFERLRFDLANLRAALNYCFTHDVQTGLELAAHLRDYWIALALSEGRLWMDRGLARAPEPSATRLQVLWGNGWVAALQGDTDAALAMLAECRTVAQQLGDDTAVSHAVQLSGVALLYQGDAEGARPLLREALEAQRAEGDKAAITLTLFYLGLGSAWRGDDDAEALFDEALEICEASGASWSRSYVLWGSSYEMWGRRNFSEASERIRESLGLQRPIGDRRGFALGTEVLAWVTAAEGRYERAARLLGGAQTMWRSIGTSLSGLAHLAHSHAECETLLRRELGDAAFLAAFDTAAEQTPDQIVAYALEEAADEGPDSSLADSPVVDPLTPREREIADLIVKGRSNKDIAAELVLSPRTVETHVEHVLTKLGFHSRTQIATWASVHQGPPRNR